jgi:SAM-dependent methyltransferase
VHLVVRDASSVNLVPVEETKLATAHQRWDDAWQDAAERAPWVDPDPAVARAVDELPAGARCLDVGCGIGRHSALLARRGFAVVATDASATAVVATRQAGAVPCARSTFGDLPFADRTFDYVVAWNVVYHGDRTIVAHALGDVARVLRPRAVYQATMLSKRNEKYGRGVEVRPDTFVVDGDAGDKAHPHFYCDEDGLLALHEPWFELRDVEEVEQQGKAGAWHWQFVMRRR